MAAGIKPAASRLTHQRMSELLGQVSTQLDLLKGALFQITARLPVMPYVYGYLRLGQRARTAEADEASLKSAGCARIFIEEAKAGVISRPIFDRLLRAANRGDTICIVSLSDLGRSLQELNETIIQLGRRHLHIRSLADELDTSIPDSKMILSAMGAVVRFCNRGHVERTLLGMRIKSDAGGTIGRPRVDMEKVKRAKRLITAGLPVPEAAKKTGLATSTLYRYLSSTQPFS